jgi:molybdopterin converting factor subunit 1
MKMEISILTFGVVREIMGSGAVTLTLTEKMTAGQLTSQLREQYPALGTLSSFAIAINGGYAASDTAITHADVVAIIPPVSGG